MGLTGSLHCAGMCGPIIWVMPFQVLSGWKKWFGIGLYHFGRISVYALIGAILHSFKSLFQPQWQQYISIIMGAVLLVVGLLSFFPNKLRFTLPWTSFVKKNLSHFISRPSVFALFITGMLNGLLPCGLVYMALSATITAPDAIHAALLMYAFGSGTVPMLVGLTILKNKTKVFGMGSRLRKFVPAFMLFFGLLFVVRGMNLGIPYLSPEVSIEQNEIKSSCCHK